MFSSKFIKHFELLLLHFFECYRCLPVELKLQWNSNRRLAVQNYCRRTTCHYTTEHCPTKHSHCPTSSIDSCHQKDYHHWWNFPAFLFNDPRCYWSWTLHCNNQQAGRIFTQFNARFILISTEFFQMEMFGKQQCLFFQFLQLILRFKCLVQNAMCLSDVLKLPTTNTNVLTRPVVQVKQNNTNLSSTAIKSQLFYLLQAFTC